MRQVMVFLVVAMYWGVWAVADEVNAGSLKLKTEGAGVTVSSGRMVLVHYQVGGVPFKPYVKQLYSPGGVNVLRDAPHDHLHHHALMFAIGAGGVDFWAETAGCGKQLSGQYHGGKGGVRNGHEAVMIAQGLEWVSGKDEKVLKEDRHLRVDRGDDGGATLLTWRSVLEPAEGKAEVKLTGSHYFGLGCRFVESMDKGGRWIYPEKKSEAVVVRGDERLVRATWCGYTAKVDGKDVTVAMFDDPGNARSPATWFTMAQPFSYISATLNLWKEPMVLQGGERLDLRYGIAVWDGQVDGSVIDRLYGKWVEMGDRKAKEQ